MTHQEWRTIAAFLENAWKDEFDGGRESAYFRALEHCNANTVMDAVVALAGGRALTKPPISAGGTYLPSSETIARECAAQDRIGSWEWVQETLSSWIREVQANYMHEHRGFIPPDEYFEEHRLSLVAVHPEHGPKLAAFVDSFGLSYLLRHGGGNWFYREGRSRWARLTLAYAEGSTDLIEGP